MSAMLFSSCQKDPQNDGELSYRFTTTGQVASLGANVGTSGAVVAKGTNGSIEWTTGTLNVAKIEFEAVKDNVKSEIEYKNLFGLDVLKSGVLAGSVTVPTGTYQQVEFKMMLEPSNTSAPLVLNGIYTELSGTKIPVEVIFNEAAELKVQGQQIVVKGDKFVADVTVELNNLVKNCLTSDFGATVRNANNKIIISNTINVNVYNKLKAALPTVAKVQITRL